MRTAAVGALAASAAAGAEVLVRHGHAHPAAAQVRAGRPGTPATSVAPVSAGHLGTLRSADALVVSSAPLSARLLARVARLPGVVATLPLSVSQPSVQDQLLALAAVDPAQYRDFAPYVSAADDAVWRRVAQGQLAADPSVRTTLPRDGVLRLGASISAPHATVGAWAPQVSGLHLVGDPSWVERLGMPRDNAVLVSTGATAPDRVVAALKRLTGPAMSVQRLDAVARDGLDLDAVQTAYVVGSVGEAIGHYDYRVTALSAHGDEVSPDPDWVREHIVTDALPIIGPVTGNRLFFPQARAAMTEVVDRGLGGAIIPSEYGGCYYPRFIAGTRVLSNHAFGLAIDLNVAQNERGTVGLMNRTVVGIFERWGFTWGGSWSYTDPMHFEINRLMSPGQPA